MIRRAQTNSHPSRRWPAALSSALPLACIALGLLLIVGQAPATAATYGRVSHIDGDLMLRGVYDDDWGFAGLNTTLREGDALWTDADSLAELELGRGIFVRIGYGTELHIDELPQDAEVRLISGSIYVSRDQRDGYMHVTTPTAQVRVRKGSIVRVDVAEDGSTRISSFRGVGTIDAGGTRLSDVDTGWRAHVYPGEGPSNWAQIGRGDKDDFDEFNREREDYYAEIELSPYVDRDIVGVYDLYRHGTWITYEHTNYWRPNYRPYRPYHTGRWGWLYGGGWSWCDNYPYGYITGHYGRWHWTSHHGWLWRPGHVWGPGWVSWVTFDNYVGWTPLDPWDRPCHVSIGLSFPIGNHGYFSIGAGSYAPKSGFHLGYVHSRPFGHSTINLIRRKNLHHLGDRPGHGDYRYVDHSFGQREHQNIGGWLRPERHMRGPARNERGHVAGDIVRRIENPTQRDKRWTWRASNTDLDALRRLREARPDRDGIGRDDGRRTADSPARPGQQFPNVAGRNPSGWTRPGDGEAGRPNGSDGPGRDERGGAERDGRPTDSPSRDRVWRGPSDGDDDDGDDNRRGPGADRGRPERTSPSEPDRGDEPRSTERPGGRADSERPEESKWRPVRPDEPERPTSVERRPEERANRARELFEQWQNRRSEATKPPTARTEPGRRIPVDRTPSVSRPTPETRPTPVERKPDAGENGSRTSFEQWRSRRSETPKPTAERPEPERRIQNPFSRNSAGRDSSSTREPVRVQPATPRPPSASERPSSSSMLDRMRERLGSRTQVESRPASPPARTITPAPVPQRSEPKTQVWSRPTTSAPARTVTPARPTTSPEPRQSSSSRMRGLFGGGSSKSSDSERPSTRSWGGRSSSSSGSSTSRSSPSSGRSSSTKSTSDDKQSSGSSSKSSSSRSGWSSRRSGR